MKKTIILLILLLLFSSSLYASPTQSILVDGNEQTVGTSGNPLSVSFGTGDQYISGNVGIGTHSPRARLEVDGSVYLHGGNIGIGTTEPASKLSLAEGQFTIPSGGTKDIPTITFSGDNNTGIYSDADGTIKFSRNGTVALSLQANGVLLGSASTPVIGNIFQDYNTNKNGFRMDSTTASIWTNSAQRLTADFSGNVGIGVTAPRGKLEVDGEIYINDLTTGARAGTAVCVSSSSALCICGSCQ